jgi:hypothetical protein
MTERKVRKQLAKGTGILRVAKSLGIGTGTVQRIANELRRMRHECAQAQTRAGARTPHPPLWKAKISYGPFRKCHAFFHSGSSAVARALHVGSRPASLGVMLAGRCEHNTSCLFGSREQIFGVNEQVRGQG